MGIDLKILIWSDFDKSYGPLTGTILDFLLKEDIPSDDKLLYATKDGILLEYILRRWALKCVRDTPLGDGRTTWDLLADPRSRSAVEVAERYADGVATDDERKHAHNAARDAEHSALYHREGDDKWVSQYTAGATGSREE